MGPAQWQQWVAAEAVSQLQQSLCDVQGYAARRHRHVHVTIDGGAPACSPSAQPVAPRRNARPEHSEAFSRLTYCNGRGSSAEVNLHAPMGALRRAAAQQRRRSTGHNEKSGPAKNGEQRRKVLASTVSGRRTRHGTCNNTTCQREMEPTHPPGDTSAAHLRRQDTQRNLSLCGREEKKPTTWRPPYQPPLAAARGAGHADRHCGHLAGLRQALPGLRDETSETGSPSHI